MSRLFDFIEVQMVWAWVVTAIARVRDDRDERGEVAEKVIIVAIMAAAAIAIATIIAVKFKDKANTIPTE